MSIQDGGPAFPVADYDHMVFEPKTVAETKRDLSGMGLRDYFAAKALAAMISNTTRSVDLGVSYPQNNANFALASYAVADAMLAARSA
ncbi:hypothetical protein ACX0K2_21215 [Pseudomonas extremorientalis]